MAAEFYHKTAALFDEFKKRELLSLNKEKELRSDLNWNHFSQSTQDYLNKISQREKEAEKTYKDLMKNMDELDRQTDQMALKIEKLHALRTVAVGSSISTWPSVGDTYDRPLQSYYHRTLSNIVPPVSPSNTSKPFQPAPNDAYQFKYSSCNQSTQTEYLFCAQCHFPITMLSTQFSENVKSGNDILNTPLHERSSTSVNTRAIFPTSENESIDQHIDILKKSDPNSLQQTPYSKEGIPEKMNERSSTSVNTSAIFPTSENESIDQHIDIPKKSDPNSLLQASYSKEGISAENSFSPQKAPIGTTSKCSQDFENNEQINNNLTHLESTMEPVEENNESIEQLTLKSDDESMNHEFDFLESNKISMPKVTFHNNVERLDRADVTSLENIPATVPDFEKETKPPNKDSYKSNYNNMSRIKVNETIKSDTTVNTDYQTPLFSDNASLASESDTLSEKDTPLTATAAYQALLGNAPSARSSQLKQAISDSDSEDEIENALATAVRKGSSVALESSETVLNSAKRKESEAEIKPKPESRGSISSSKPQSKLSKNTRKVLGLDTSSGSEMELALPNTSKKDEDSDEFDFYD